MESYDGNHFNNLKNQKEKKLDALARKILSHARNTLFLRLQFLRNALGRCDFMPYHGKISCDGVCFWYDPVFVIRQFQAHPDSVTKIYLHTILHCLFQHKYIGDSVEQEVWNLACDIAVEQTVRELLPELAKKNPAYGAQKEFLDYLDENLNYVTAEKIYDFLGKSGMTDAHLTSLRTLFAEDEHSAWYAVSNIMENFVNSRFAGIMPDDAEIREMWAKLSRQMQIDLEYFSQGVNGGHMLQNLRAIHQERCDYKKFLRRFAVSGETMRIDPDAFDYQFYCYGLSLYKNLALVEPLEYKNVRAIREFVIAIDTSSSVMGKTVQRFIEKTYHILKSQESFFSKINLHIIQCDAEIQEDFKITSQEEFDNYIRNMCLKGFGGTDFRPVFDHVNDLIWKKEFQNLKGLLYFTDGFGTYPARKPDYQTAFVFLDDHYQNPAVPSWAIRVILRSEDILE
ncbi:MAG: metallopeptidase [Oscillospiraceae bacterium]|nr:metallopeptidase [Oscillospiraceae bacterium]